MKLCKKIILCLFISLSIVGCSVNSNEEVKADNSRMIKVYSPNDYKIIDDYTILKDAETGVEYLIYYTSRADGGIAITPLYNADGTLKVSN